MRRTNLLLMLSVLTLAILLSAFQLPTSTHITLHTNEKSTPKRDSILMSVSENETTKDMILVEGGTFMMGSNNGDYDEVPVHKVQLSSFYIDKYEVTNEQFCKFLNEKGNQSEGGALWLEIDDEDCHITQVGGKFIPKKGREKHPVIEVSWYAAVKYAEWLGKRLPTEAEWEYAARGGQKSNNFKYAGSNDAALVACFDDNSDGNTFPVGQLKPNELGIYDMSGNVWEWVNDWYADDYYKKSETKNPKGPNAIDFKILRGGSWVSIEDQLRVSIRDYAYPYNTYYLNGFRCVRNVE